MAGQPHNLPSEVTAEEGEVLVDGPGGVAISFTPEAAEETSHRLLDGAVRATGEASRRKAGAAAGRPPDG